MCGNENCINSYHDAINNCINSTKKTS